MKNKTRSLALAITLLFLFVGVAKAETIETTASPSPLPLRMKTRAESMELQREAKKENIEDRCERIETKIDFRINNAETNSDKYNNRYGGIRKKLVDLTTKLEEKGCEVEEVRSNLDTFNDMIEEFAAAQRIFVASLKSSKAFVCGESEGEFAASVNTSRQNHLTMRLKAAGLQSYFKNTLRPNVKAMGDACKAKLKVNAKTGEGVEQ